MPIVAPAELRVYDDREWSAPGVVAIVEAQVFSWIADFVTKHRIRPADAAPDRSRIRIEQNLVWVKAMTGGWVVRSMNSVTVQLTRTNVGQEAMPDSVRLFFQDDRVGFCAIARRIEQAQFDFRSVFGKESKVDAAFVRGGSQRIRLSRPDSWLHGSLHIRSQAVFWRKPEGRND